MDSQTVTALSTLIGVLATLVTAIAALIKVIQHDEAIANTNAKVNQIETNTNGVMSKMQEQLTAGSRAPGTRRATDPPPQTAAPVEAPSA